MKFVLVLVCLSACVVSSQQAANLAYDAHCTVGADTCQANMECKGTPSGKCACMTDFLPDGTNSERKCYMKIGKTKCDDNTAPCHSTAKCNESKVCVCPPGKASDSTAQKCVAGYDADCTETCGVNLQCTQKKCGCQTDTLPETVGSTTNCYKKIDATACDNITAPCHSSATCNDAKVCVCPHGLMSDFTSLKCVAAFGETCESTAADSNNCQANMVCKDAKCECKTDFLPDKDNSVTKCYMKIGATACDKTTAPCHNTATCSNTKVCSCPTGFLPDSNSLRCISAGAAGIAASVLLLAAVLVTSRVL